MKAVLLSGHHLLLTDAIKRLTREKLEKLFHLDERIQRARVELIEERDRTSATKFRFTAKAILDGADAVATAASEDLYKSIDLLVRKLGGQLRRKHQVNASTPYKRRNDAPGCRAQKMMAPEGGGFRSHCVFNVCFNPNFLIPIGGQHL